MTPARRPRIAATRNRTSAAHGSWGSPAASLSALRVLRNAIVHTPPGTPIDVTVRREHHEVMLYVRDRGKGLPSGNGGEISERFWRAEGGRVRGKAGAGLGLAIVDGIVRAHSGHVTASKAPGGSRGVTRSPST